MKVHIASVLQSIHVQTRTRTTEVHLRTLQNQNLQFERLLREREHEIDILRHQLANLESRLQEMGGTDVLTNLPNRHVFSEQLTLSLKRALRLGYSLSLMLVDIDHLREINLRHGYEVGDAVLVEVAQILKSSVREIDMVSRWGGEELAAVLHETDSEGASIVAERIRKKIARLEIVDPKTRKPFKVTATLSVSSYPAHSHEVQGLLESAGEALLAAKLGGCNKVVIATR